MLGLKLIFFKALSQNSDLTTVTLYCVHGDAGWTTFSTSSSSSRKSSDVLRLESSNAEDVMISPHFIINIIYATAILLI